jgi:hypothetical protein
MLDTLVDRYCLMHDLAQETEQQYRRIADVFVGWAEGRELTADSLSEFLRYKQRLGRSPWYVRSLRSHLLAVLRFSGEHGEVRPIRCGQLPADEWGPVEVQRLVAGCECLPAIRRQYWRTLIQAAWWTGLSGVDLHLVRREQVAADGTLRILRHKTRAEVLVWLPVELVSHVAAGLVWPRPWSAEWDRRTFQRIATAAGLVGTHKKLRRSSGVSVEILHLGHGHEHLGNSRPVFERHYLRRRIVRGWKPASV